MAEKTVTLDEYVGLLPSQHLAAKQLKELREERDALKHVLRELVANHPGLITTLAYLMKEAQEQRERK
jgi:uncharacterized coiled-coil DUF342 family protein